MGGVFIQLTNFPEALAAGTGPVQSLFLHLNPSPIRLNPFQLPLRLPREGGEPNPQRWIPACAGIYMVLPRQSCHRRRLFGFPRRRERRRPFNTNTENEKALGRWAGILLKVGALCYTYRASIPGSFIRRFFYSDEERPGEQAISTNGESRR